MKVDVVVDVGNTRIKWGLCSGGRIEAVAGVPPDDEQAWRQQIQNWRLAAASSWAVSGVHPARCDRLAEWLRSQGHLVAPITDWRQLGLDVPLERPDYVGVDRLLDAVAVNSRRAKHRPAIILDPGSAVTADYVDEAGAFRGGAIFPGLRLMAKALKDYTALLPLVEIREPHPALPGISTPKAMEAGIYWAVAGGIRALIDEMSAVAKTRPEVWLTGGDAALLAPALPADVLVWPEMTLEGVRLTAERLP